MRIFSILQTCLLFQFFGQPGLQQSIDFGQDPDDSSILRLRITPPQDAKEPLPDDAEALEFTFDRNGRVRDQRSWPMRYPAWDKRTPEDIEKVIAAMAEDASAKGEAAKVAVGLGDGPVVPQSRFRRT